MVARDLNASEDNSVNEKYSTRRLLILELSGKFDTRKENAMRILRKGYVHVWEEGDSNKEKLR